METFEYRKSRTCEMKEDKYVKSLAKNQVYAYARYSEKRFTEMYKALYRDAMFVSRGRRKPTETSVIQCFYLCVNSSLQELIKIKAIFILRQGMFRQQNLQKTVMFLTHLRAFPATSQKPGLVTQKPGNSSVLYRKTKNPLEPKICLYKLKVLRCSNIT